MTPIPLRVALAAVVALSLAGASPSRHATYRIHGTVHVTGTAFDQDMELHADAVVEPGSGKRDVSLHLASMGYRCRLVATRDAAGQLAFPSGQTCVLDVQSPEAQGRVQVQLTSGSGRLGEEHLSVSFTSRLSGAVKVGSGPPVTVFGQTVPGTGGAEIPVRGEARASAEGNRDHSRAADQ